MTGHLAPTGVSRPSNDARGTNMKNKLKSLMHLSIAQVERMEANGYVDATLARAFRRVWSWSSERFSGDADARQQAFWDRYGRRAYYRRINRVRTAFGFPTIGGDL